MDTEPRWEQLAVAVKVARGLRSQKAIAEAGGPSDTTIGKIEANEWRPTRAVEDTLRKLDEGLGWGLGTAAAILAGHVSINRDAKPIRTTRHQGEIEFLNRRALIESKPEKDRTQEEKDWLAKTVPVRNRVVHRVRDTPPVPSHLATMVELSFLSDDADAAASHLTEPDLSDEDEVQNYVWDVGELVNAVEYLTRAVHDAAVEAAGGDVANLRRIKREVRRARMGPDIFDLLADLDADDKPQEAAADVAADSGPAENDTNAQDRRLPRVTNSQLDRDRSGADAPVSGSETDSGNTTLGDQVPRGFLADQIDASAIDESTVADEPHGADRH
ncbi:hypothetical protein OS122_02775 [Mycolicibacterium mucogenicum]|uniref:hypothetical protein n=1 Tax=Mycolicibacterium mucogenicum TaxID=56689 RepID=UPI002269CB41|nr:hypothetical protein [Mycolicibacterium mucogenicum]MCX8559823.1 hypothetical protein [Mycolicibacterium mucogenicum]